MDLQRSDKQVTGTYVFGILSFVILTAVVLFGSGVDPQAKDQIVRVLCAAGAGLAGSFISGKIAIEKGKLPGWSNVPITATGGFALFLVVFYGWGGVAGKTVTGPTGPPTNAPSSVVHVRVVDSNQNPIPNAIVMLHGTASTADQRGELDIPLSAFARGSIQMADLMAEGFEQQTGRLDANVSGVQTLTMSAKAKDLDVEARIVDEENRPRMTSWVRLIGCPGEPRKAMTGSDGIVRFHLPAGTSRESLKIDANFPGYEPQLVSVGAKDELIQIKLVARHMRLQVTVIDQRSGRPIQNAQVEVVGVASKVADASGRCSFDINLAKVSKVLVNATKQGYELGSQDIPAGSSTERVIALKGLAGHFDR